MANFIIHVLYLSLSFLLLFVEENFFENSVQLIYTKISNVYALILLFFCKIFINDCIFIDNILICFVNKQHKQFAICFIQNIFDACIQRCFAKDEKLYFARDAKYSCIHIIENIIFRDINIEKVRSSSLYERIPLIL